MKYNAGMNGQAERCLAVHIRIPQNKISYLKFLLEGYDGLSILSTLESSSGLIRLLVPHSRYPELFNLLSAIAGELI